ncbi:MAG: glycosyltransferase family 4 protein, partial [Candidatus Bathyarchaeia archaeon]
QHQDNLVRKYLTPYYNIFSDSIKSYKYREILEKFSKIVAVSKAIPKEMGSIWERRVIPLDPGVSLDDEDIQLINSLRRAKSSEKKNYIVFGGRPTASKGLIEGLMAFKLISKSSPNLRMIVTGNIDDATLVNLNRFCKNIGINKVAFTGFLPRADRFRIVSESILMLYPSHVDAFPYAVCESLYLGTPVVAYKIPALEIYYGKLNGVKLVEGGDFEALAEEAINVLTNKVDVEIPKIKSWDEIMHEEIGLILETIQA